MNGGYSMMDFSGCDLGNLGTVMGIYERTKAANRVSPRLLHTAGLKVQRPCSCPFSR